jgi:predicted nucleic acid-binding protein
MAEFYNLNKTGVLGILLLAKKQSSIPSLKLEMDKLRDKAHFWINMSLYKKLLKEARE